MIRCFGEGFNQEDRNKNNKQTSRKNESNLEKTNIVQNEKNNNILRVITETPVFIRQKPDNMKRNIYKYHKH